MLKAIGTLQLALAPVFVIPAMSGQEESGLTQMNLESQLQSTLGSIEYLAGLRSSARTGDVSAVRAIINATETPREVASQRTTQLAGLQDELARLRFQLDRLLSDPGEVAAVTAMPPSVVQALGLGGAAVPAPTPPAPGTEGPVVASETVNPSHVEQTDATNPHAARPDLLQGTSPTPGLEASMRAAIEGDIAPLARVSDSSRRRGEEPVPLEESGYVADPVHLGKLLVRAGRPAEAVEVLKKNQSTPAARYWLARALQGLDRNTEAIALYRTVASDSEAGLYGRHASQDLEFLEFKAALKKK